MDAWRRSSPYRFIGIYVSGVNRSCPQQANLTASWIQGRGAWGFQPLDVSLQPSCATMPGSKMSSNSTTTYQQGGSAANAMTDAMNGLGFPAGSVGYYDLEQDPGSCGTSTLGYVHGFINQMESRHYHGGLYSSCSARWSTYATSAPAPYALWVAELLDGDSPGHSVITTKCIPNTAYWSQGQWTRQWLQNIYCTYGGKQLLIDDDCAYTGKVDASFITTGVAC